MKLLQVGISYSNELRGGIGHTACTLAGVNYESSGSRGCIKGTTARGADNPLFRHRYYLLLTDGQAATAKRYADQCIGRPYVWGGVPSASRGGDCSGFVSGIICAARGWAIHRLFGTGNWVDREAGLGFHVGLGPANPPPVPGKVPAWPGRVLADQTPGKLMHGADVTVWQLQMRHRGWSVVPDGMFGPASAQVCRQFQVEKHLGVDGRVGPQTWAAAFTRPVT
jgi:peptidoglycan hydrolase-like protein with peptidoglycan-binding domain